MRFLFLTLISFLLFSCEKNEINKDYIEKYYIKGDFFDEQKVFINTEVHEAGPADNFEVYILGDQTDAPNRIEIRFIFSNGQYDISSITFHRNGQSASVGNYLSGEIHKNGNIYEGTFERIPPDNSLKIENGEFKVLLKN